MRIFRNFNNLEQEAEKSVLTLGNFDGLHLGHQDILKKAKKIANKKGLKSALLTFEPHPTKIIRPDNPKNIRISSLSEKLEILKKNNLVDIVFIVNFNQKLANLSAEEFIKDILKDKLKINHLVIGYDFTFGKNRSGNAILLEKLAKTHGYEFSKIEVNKNASQSIYSSTNIRNFIKEGDIKSANLMLGHPYQIQGIVIEGKKLARSLGFPTANLLPKPYSIKPKYGVYKANVKIKSQTYKAIVNFGIKPTFKGNTPLFEVHIFGFSSDIYGQKIAVEFLDFIREERKFNSVEELREQIVVDCDSV